MTTEARTHAAARWLAENGGLLDDAAVRFGVTRQGVAYGWRRLYGDRPLPSIQQRAELRARAIELRDQAIDTTRTGAVLNPTLVEGSLKREHIARLARAAGLPVTVMMHAVMDKAKQTAIGAIREGSSIAEAAAAVGLDEATVGRAARAAGVQSARALIVRRDGRTLRAAERVLAGERLTDACRAERATMSGVSTLVAKMRAAALDPRTPPREEDRVLAEAAPRVIPREEDHAPAEAAPSAVPRGEDRDLAAAAPRAVPHGEDRDLAASALRAVPHGEDRCQAGSTSGKHSG